MCRCPTRVPGCLPSLRRVRTARPMHRPRGKGCQSRDCVQPFESSHSRSVALRGGKAGSKGQGGAQHRDRLVLAGLPSSGLAPTLVTGQGEASRAAQVRSVPPGTQRIHEEAGALGDRTDPAPATITAPARPRQPPTRSADLGRTVTVGSRHLTDFPTGSAAAARAGQGTLDRQDRGHRQRQSAMPWCCPRNQVRPLARFPRG